MTPGTRQRRARRLATLAFTTAALLTFAPAAMAEPPQRVGWWNMLSAGAAAAPAPATPAGGIHVATGPGQVLAYGAVLYPMPADATAQLKLTIAGSQGTPDLQACPTKGTGWKAGDDQPSDAAPAYDCSATHYPGTMSANGTSVTFNVTTFGATTAGQVSLAIVPDLSAAGSPATGVNQPFSADIDKPAAGSLVITSAPPPSTPPSPAAAAQPPAPAPSSTSIAAGRPLGVPIAPLPADTQAVAPAGPAPQVAPSATPAPTNAVRSSAHSTGGLASTAGTVIGVLALVAALTFWGLGRGLLGGRIVPLSVPLTQNSPASPLQ